MIKRCICSCDLKALVDIAELRCKRSINVYANLFHK